MSLIGYKKYIEEGDLIIVFIGHESMVAVTVKNGDITQTKYGALRHNDFIGKEFGSRVHTINKKGYVHILHPTSELWTVTLPHRTQILYFTDISMITMQLELKPGSVVVESGTGSGSMSHAIARTIAPNGHLYSFEFHEQRAQLATTEFKEHGLGDIISVEHKDVCDEGFGLDLKVDAVFLDLPSPHLVIGHAKNILKSGGRICSFSPCIEQVQNTCKELNTRGFIDVTTMEVLLRNYDARTVNFPMPNLGESHRDETLKLDQNDEVTVSDLNDGIQSVHGTKVTLTADCMSGKGGERDEMLGEKVPGNVKRVKKDGERRQRRGKSIVGQNTMKCAVPSRESPGHTGYLTFATLVSSKE